MNRISASLYFGAYIFIALAFFSFMSHGWQTFTPILFAFGFIPLVELVLPPLSSHSGTKHSLCYDLVIYSLVLAYGAALIYFMSTIGYEKDPVSLVGKTLSMGLLHGIFGINMAHELGHRRSKFNQFLAQLLLWSSQYTHFFVEHNRGHHKRVATPDDPATARKGENLYFFWMRSVRDSYWSAWDLENESLRRKKIGIFTWKNDMVKYSIFQLVLVMSVGVFFGIKVLVVYLLACVFGILLLESINYVEHYGLVRKKISKSSYERVQPSHSWNSDHVLGRYLLFELTRHSHHHENSLTPYSELQSKDNGYQLPTGYPGMMLLGLIPSLFFKVMDKRLFEVTK